MSPAPTPSAPHPLRQQILLVAAFAIVAGASMLLPLRDLHLPHDYYLPLHTGLEFISVAASFLVFATVWHTARGEESGSYLLIAIALFTAGWLDFFHALSFKGMPDLVSPASVEKGIAFWLAARLVVAVTWFAVAMLPRLPVPSRRLRRVALSVYLALGLIVVWTVLFHESALPRTYLDGEGVTPVKRWLEWIVTGLLALAAWRYYRLALRSRSELPSLIFGAAAVAALSELFFTQYEVISDAQNLLGHLYKFICYAFLYRAMFVLGVRRPYEELARQTATLKMTNEKLRTQSLALDSIAATVVVTELDGRIRWRNRASRRLSGELPDAVEQNLSLFEAPFSPHPTQARDMRAALAAGRVWQGEVHGQDSQGEYVVLDRTVTPLRTESGEPVGYVSVSENVTERNRAELRHRRVLQTAIDGFLVVDKDGFILEANAAYARMSGYAPGELVGMHLRHLESSESEQAFRTQAEIIRRDGRARFETRHRRKDGSVYAVEAAVTYDPQASQYYVFARDRSEREQAQAVQLDLERQLQQSQKVQALGQLTGGVAHDFNNILAAILGYSNLALERFVPDKKGKLAAYLREVIKASERARDLVAKMLSFARTQPSVSVGVISPATVLRETVAMMRASIPSSIELRSRVDSEQNIRMDPGELNQVLVNLIINARDAMGEHGVIDLHLHPVQMEGQLCAISQQRLSGPYVALDVSDDGSGIAAEHLPRLFDPFFTTKDVGKGTGLGLSVVQGILRRSGAHVVVESTHGQGSRFRLLFSAATADVPVAPPPEDSRTPPRGHGQQVWVVDDEATVAGYLNELLVGWGYRVRVFSDPADALASLEATPDQIDLLITDQTMPGLSGLQLAQLARHFKPGLPVVLCTGVSDSVDMWLARQEGIRHIFNKPLPVSELAQVLADELA